MLSATRGGHAVDPGPQLAGRPLPWLALQAPAALTVGAAVVVAGRLSVVPRCSLRRFVPLMCGAATFVPWALYWGLLLP